MSISPKNIMPYSEKYCVRHCCLLQLIDIYYRGKLRSAICAREQKLQWFRQKSPFSIDHYSVPLQSLHVVYAIILILFDNMYPICLTLLLHTAGELTVRLSACKVFIYHQVTVIEFANTFIII